MVYWFAYLQVGLRVGLEVIEGWVCQKIRLVWDLSRVGLRLGLVEN